MAVFRRQPAENDDDAIPSRRRAAASERTSGGFFRIATRITGLKPALVPAHLRKQFAVVGVDDETLARVLGSLKNLADWPYAWEAAGDEFLANGDVTRAATAYYMSQRVLLTPSRLKSRLYRLTTETYLKIPQPTLEVLRVDAPAGTVAGYLQLPERAGPAGGFPLVVMLPGVTATKEEMHPFAEALLARGRAVARIDNPGYGETEGLLRDDSMRNAAHVMESLAHDPRLNADAFHLFSMSLGGFCALHSAIDSRARSLTIVAAPFYPHKVLADLPGSNITALKHMAGYDSFDDLYRLIRRLSLEPIADQIKIPVRIFHGGRDKTIPVSHAQLIADGIGGDAAVTIYERDHHNCLEHFDDMMAATLEFLDDPAPVIAAYQREVARNATQAAAAERRFRIEKANTDQARASQNIRIPRSGEVTPGSG